jgi:hypothetical protein
MKQTPLKRVGKNKARESNRYWRLRLKFIQDHPFCEFPSYRNGTEHALQPVFTLSCTNRTASIHHMKGQHHKIMNDTRYWLATCQKHHAWIEDNKREARKRGLILYK